MTELDTILNDENFPNSCSKPPCGMNKGITYACNKHAAEERLENEKFIDEFNRIQRIVHKNAIDKGFWNDTDAKQTGHVLGKLMLIVSEIAEAGEAARSYYPLSDKINDYGNFEEELADAIIRIMDLAERMGVQVSEAVIAKMQYNTNRPYMHGKTA